MGNQKFDDFHAELAGASLNSLFSAIAYDCPDLSYKEQRKTFLDVVERWLSEGKVKFLNPDRWENASGNNDKFPHYWEESPRQIVNTFIKEWPEDDSPENSIERVVFLHSMPSLIWIMPNGEEIIS